MAKAAKTPAKTPMKAAGGMGGPKTPQMKGKTPNKAGKTPVQQQQAGKTPKGKTPVPAAPPQKVKTPKPQPNTPKTKTPKPQPDTPRPPKVATPAQNGTNGTASVKKQKPVQQQRQQAPPQSPVKSPKVNKQQQNNNKKQQSAAAQARTIRLTFPAGSLKSLEQVKQMVPTASTIKFPNVVFVEFASEAEADKQHAKLQPLIKDGQLNQINFVGEKERLAQTKTRGFDQTRLFVRGIGNATEADIRKLFPTSSQVVIRGHPGARGHAHSHKYCFVVFATAAACTEALEKSKGLTLFGEPLKVSYAFMRKDTAVTGSGDSAVAEKRPATDPADAPATNAAKKAKQAIVEKKEEEEESDDDEEEEEGDEEEDEDDDDEEEDDEDDDDDDDEEEGEAEDEEDDDDDDDDEDDDDDDDEDDDGDDDDDEE